jgi:hypothetical protein
MSGHYCNAAIIGVQLLLDDLVGAQQNRWGYRKAERRGALRFRAAWKVG